MKRIIITVIACIMLFSFFTVLPPIEICRADGTTIYVDDSGGADYDNINDAINAANDDDTIYVYSGIYNEYIIINRSLTLTGAGSSSTTIKSPSSSKHTIEITSNNVNISGFTVTNYKESYSSIKLSSVSNCKISNNFINNGGNGIYLVHSSSNTIQDNTIDDNNIGIYVSSDSNTIKDNNIQNNVMNGIFIDSSSTSNIIYLNDFSNNADGSAKDYGSNNWDYSSQGNYWDDYNDYDSDSNGIGDNPYTIEGGAGNKDNYPLGDFLSSNQQPVAYIDSISPNPASIGQLVTFNGHGSRTDDGSILNWEWNSSIDGFLIYSKNYESSSLSAGTHTISYRVQDNDGVWSSYVYETLEIQSQNQKPTAYILEPITSVTEYYGESINFLGSFSDDGDVIEYSWRSSKDGVLSDAIQFIKNDLTVGQHTIYFKVKDNDGNWSSEASIAVTILSNLSNNPPFADAGGHYTGYVNQSITFDGSGSYDPDDGDDITSYQWDFGDGSTGEGMSPEHTYTSEGNYTVELTVIDGHDEQNKNTTYANISIQSNGQNGNAEEDGGFPGFELIFVLIASIIILFWIKKRKGN